MVLRVCGRVGSRRLFSKKACRNNFDGLFFAGENWGLMKR